MLDDLDTPSKIFSAVMVVLTGAIGVLWKDLKVSNKRCEEKHDASTEKIIKLTDSVARVEGEMSGYAKAIKKTDEMHDQLLREVKKQRGD